MKAIIKGNIELKKSPYTDLNILYFAKITPEREYTIGFVEDLYVKFIADRMQDLTEQDWLDLWEVIKLKQ